MVGSALFMSSSRDCSGTLCVSPGREVVEFPPDFTILKSAAFVPIPSLYPILILGGDDKITPH